MNTPHSARTCDSLYRQALLAALLWPLAARAELELIPDKEPPRVFAGASQRINVRFHNAGADRVDVNVRTSLYQASSATAIPLGEAPWKRLEVLPAQTVLESATVAFPAIKGETRFLVKWVADTNKVIGTTEVLVYPTNLLKELKTLAGDKPLGVLDPANLLKPLLKAAAAEYDDLDNAELEDYTGKLAIIGPFASKAQMQEGLPGRIKALAGKGVAVVWIQPPAPKRDGLKPSFYTVRQGKGAVVVARAALVANLADDPQAQLNLVELARAALHPAPPELPQLMPAR